jgi:hypothetical protein
MGMSYKKSAAGREGNTTDELYDPYSTTAAVVPTVAHLLHPIDGFSSGLREASIPHSMQTLL